jgi:hypothetical protein
VAEVACKASCSKRFVVVLIPKLSQRFHIWKVIVPMAVRRKEEVGDGPVNASKSEHPGKRHAEGSWKTARKHTSQ